MTLFTSLGIHPHALVAIDSRHDEDLLVALDRELLHRSTHVVAIGECGVDLRKAWTARVPRARQEAMLRGHIELSLRHRLPLVVHCLGAHTAVLELLGRVEIPPAIFHSWSGSSELARRVCRAGHFVSFSGSLALANARRLHEAARAVPHAQMLIETDAPDQTPPRHRPAINEPAFVVDVALALANCVGEPIERIAEWTTRNAFRAFALARSG